MSLRLTPSFINLGFSANTVTTLAFVVALASLGVTLLGALDPLAFIAVGLLFHVVYVLDNIDGHIARFHGASSLVGGMYDTLVTWVHKALFPLALGLALTLGDAGWVPFAERAEAGWIWLVAGGIRSFSYLFMIALGRKTDVLLTGLTGGVRPADSTIARVARTLEEVEPILLMLSVPVGMVGMLHLSYAVFGLLSLITVTVLCLRRLRHADKTSPTSAP